MFTPNKKRFKLLPSAISVASALSVILLASTTTGCSQNEADSHKTQQTINNSSSMAEAKVLVDFDNQTNSYDVIQRGANTQYIQSPLAENSADKENKRLLIDFTKDEYVSAVVIKSKKTWDLSANEVHLAIDATNTSEESLQLYLSLSYAEENSTLVSAGSRTLAANYSVNLAPGESGTYFVVLSGEFIDTKTGMRDNPVPWETDDKMFVWRYGNKEMDLSKINELSLFVRGNLTDKQVAVDNITLQKNPAYDNSYLTNLVDEFGQNAKQEFPTKIHSTEELKAAADKELAQLKAEGPMKDRSRFGGWKSGPRQEATGYFRTQKIDDQWWLVDPEGYLFFSHGVANVRMANSTTITGVDFHDDSVRYVDPNEVTPEDSIGIVNVSDKVLASRYISSELRHNLFSWLPDYDDPLAKHYSYRRSVHKGPVTSGETFSFYRANLERRYGEGKPDDYIRKWEEVTLDRMNNWGFTSFGNWVDPAFYDNEKVPYFANGWIIGDFKTLKSEHDVWAPLPDPYDAEFAHRAKVTIDVIAEEIKGSPWCAGIFIDNEKSWGFPTGTPDVRYAVIVSTLKQDSKQSPAKKAFADYLQSKYQTIAQYNNAWHKNVASWDGLSAGITVEQYSDSVVEDLSTMLEMLSDQYFKVVHDTLEAALPNHLYMGARMANFGMPKETIKASVKYSDVLSFNIYEEGVQPQEWDFLNVIDLPTVIGEFHIGAISDTGLVHPGLVMASDQTDRANMYLNYMESVAIHKNMVGAHWFQYLDSPLTGRAFDGEPYNVGFVSTTDIPYPAMIKAAKAFNSTVYSKRFNKEYK